MIYYACFNKFFTEDKFKLLDEENKIEFMNYPLENYWKRFQPSLLKDNIKNIIKELVEYEKKWNA